MFMTVFGMPRQRDVGSVLEQIGNRVFENQGGKEDVMKGGSRWYVGRGLATELLG